MLEVNTWLAVGVWASACLIGFLAGAILISARTWDMVQDYRTEVTEARRLAGRLRRTVARLQHEDVDEIELGEDEATADLRWWLAAVIEEGGEVDGVEW